MKWVQNSDSKTHVKKLNPTARTDISNKTLWGIFESLRIVLVHTKMTIKKNNKKHKDVSIRKCFHLWPSIWWRLFWEPRQLLWSSFLPVLPMSKKLEIHIKVKVIISNVKKIRITIKVKTNKMIYENLVNSVNSFFLPVFPMSKKSKWL